MTKSILKLGLTILFIFTLQITTALADCDEPQTQTEMNICAAEEYKTADKELNEAYSKHTNGLSDAHLEALKQAQLAWIKYRDLACASFGLSAEGGSMEGMLVNMCRTRLTAERTDLLTDQFLSPEETEEADAEEAKPE
ncbi:MAG: hypothetical protein DHS20C08_10340 [Rhodomicrobium sp.]|nr:MAG: hypothetical protein DHS20C08_10340 [Rhodomicrobium sp.]